MLRFQLQLTLPKRFIHLAIEFGTKVHRGLFRYYLLNVQRCCNCFSAHDLTEEISLSV